MKVRLLCVCLTACCVWIGATAVVSFDVSAQEAGAYRPPPPPPQPIAFSHKQHAIAKLGCLDCHKTATSGVSAGIPLGAQCVACHKEPSTPALKTLHDLAAAGDIPWRRVVRVPDYVTFSHETHMASARTKGCDWCHGKVEEMTATQKVYDMSMAACVQCHKETGAAESCDTCHEPRG